MCADGVDTFIEDSSPIPSIKKKENTGELVASGELYPQRQAATYHF